MAKLSLKRQRELLAAARSPRGGALATNGHNLCAAFNPAPRKVYVSYRAAVTGRAYQSAAWQVVGIGFLTNPDGHWRDYGHRTFTVYAREQKEPQRMAAIAWATEQGYGTVWMPDPFGDYQTAETMAAYAAWLAEATA